MRAVTPDPQRIAAVAGRAELLVTAQAVDVALDRMAFALTERLAGRDPLILCVMTGAVVLAGLLLPRLPFPLRLDYLHASRYGGATRGGDIVWLRRPTEAIRGEHVLLLDDILDEGVTLEHLVGACREDGAASILTAVLVEKIRPHRREADIVGVRVPDRYVFGYGLDYRGYCRNAAGIYAIADQDA